MFVPRSQMEYKADCGYDHVQVSYLPASGVQEVFLGKMCSAGLSPGSPRIFSLEGVSRANVNFKSDPATNGRGFKMAYKAVAK